MRFKGTIVITDPCYLDDDINNSNLWENSNYGEDLFVFGCSQWICEDTLYGDWSCFTYKGIIKEVNKKIREWDRYYIKFFNKYNKTENPKDKETLLEEHKIKRSEFIKENTLGEFCADTGMVCVVYLDEVLVVNPNFKKWAENHPWCATIIEDFDGEVNYIIDNDEAHIEGIGNINFYTSQSGF